MLHLSCVLDKESYMAICKSSFVLAREWVGYNGFEYCRVSIMSQNMLFPKSIYLPWSCLNIFIEKKKTRVEGRRMTPRIFNVKSPFNEPVNIFTIKSRITMTISIKNNIS